MLATTKIAKQTFLNSKIYENLHKHEMFYKEELSLSSLDQILNQLGIKILNVVLWHLELKNYQIILEFFLFKAH
jgi:hypothetical protein